MIFITAYFFTTNPEVVEKLGEYAVGKMLGMALSLSAAFWIGLCPDAYKKFLPYFTLIFGNEDEIDAMNNLLKLGKTRKDAVIALAKLPVKSNMPRTVIMTCGSSDLMCCVYDPVSKKDEFFTDSVLPIDKKDIVDTIGAGDAFASGVLIGLCKGKPIRQAIKAGKYCSWAILQHEGCDHGDKMTYKFI